MSREVMRAFTVPDAAIHPWRLVNLLADDVRRQGGRVLTRHQVTAINTEGGRVRSVRIAGKGTERVLEVDAVVNAAGPWSARVAALAGGQVDLELTKGSILVLAHRVVGRAVNRCRPPTSHDIVVPNGTVSLFGTTSEVVNDPDITQVRPQEVQALLDGAEPLLPGIRACRALRAWAGVRPLFKPKEWSGEGPLPRRHRIVDHGEEGIEQFFSLCGGSLTTHRLMAEEMCDHVCRRLGVNQPCRTASTLLDAGGAVAPWRPVAEFEHVARGPRSVLCECEAVEREAIETSCRQRAYPRSPPTIANRVRALSGNLLRAARGRSDRDGRSRIPGRAGTRGVLGRAPEGRGTHRLARPGAPTGPERRGVPRGAGPRTRCTVPGAPVRTDAVVLGAELDALVAALRLLEMGHSVRIFAPGAGSFHFSPGGVHLLRSPPDNGHAPLDRLPALDARHPLPGRRWASGSARRSTGSSIPRETWASLSRETGPTSTPCPPPALRSRSMVRRAGWQRFRRCAAGWSRSCASGAIATSPAALVASSLRSADARTTVVEVEPPGRGSDSMALAHGFDDLRDVDAYFATAATRLPRRDGSGGAARRAWPETPGPGRMLSRIHHRVTLSRGADASPERVGPEAAPRPFRAADCTWRPDPPRSPWSRAER